MVKLRLHSILLLALLAAQSNTSRAQDDASTDQEEAAPDQEDTNAPQVKSGKAAGASREPKARGQRGDDPEQAAAADKLRVASSTHVRRFHEVLDELLAEFGYDVKMGQIKGLSNVAVRKVRVSQAIPKTYEEYVETLVEERIRENSQVRIIDCIPCKTRTSSLVDGKLMITSPATNMAKLDSAAAMLGIENFMDVVLVYHTTHMVLAVSVFNAQTKELVWARTYNSETLKTRYQKLAVDYSQIETARTGEDYVPDYRFMIGLGGAGLPNVGGTAANSTMLDLQIRATEKFNNRHDEFGMLLSVLRTTSALQSSYPSSTPAGGTGTTTTTTTTPTPTPFSTAIAVYGVYSHLFLGAVESYNEVRQGLNVGLGGLFATGYLAPAARLGYDIYMGRRFSVSFGGDYVGPATIVIDSQTVHATGGPGGDIVMSLNY